MTAPHQLLQNHRSLKVTGVAFSLWAAAVRERNQAIYNQVIAEALQYGTSNTPLAAQLILAAYRIQPTSDAASRLLNTENSPLPSSLAARNGSASSVAFSRDGQTLASGNAVAQLWDIADPAHLRSADVSLAWCPESGSDLRGRMPGW